MMEEIKNCPFCGGIAILCSYEKSHQVYCACCSTVQMGVFYETSQEAIEAWNKRFGEI